MWRTFSQRLRGGLRRPQPADPEAPSHQQEDADIRKVNMALLPLLALALLAAACLGWRANATCAVLLWAIASLSAGAAAGFLFGIPRAAAGGRQPTDNAPPPGSNGAAEPGEPRARPNTNLEEVSDWLTKIIVGLTLVHAQQLEGYVTRVTRNAAASLKPSPGAAEQSVATALVVGFFVIGFLGAYLYTRLFLQGAFVRSDRGLGEFRRSVDAALQVARNDPQPAPDSTEPAVPSSAIMAAAQRVADHSPAGNPEAVLGPLKRLAAEYEALRSRMPEFSAARTRAMGDIVLRMRPYAIAAADHLQQLMDSPSPGERLAAVVILQMRFMPEHTQWLAQRLVEERSFIGYQAASALLARIRVVGAKEGETIKQAVRAAKAQREQLDLREAQLDALIAQILKAE